MTISVEAIKYLGRNVCALRSWDGYDKPQKTPMFEITEDEIDFAGGRFKLFSYALKGYSQKFSLPADKEKIIEPIINWIDENVEGLWYFDISDKFEDCHVDGEYFWNAWVFYFKSDEDCVKFTLRWM